MCALGFSVIMCDLIFLIFMTASSPRSLVVLALVLAVAFAAASVMLYVLGTLKKMVGVCSLCTDKRHWPHHWNSHLFRVCPICGELHSIVDFYCAMCILVIRVLHSQYWCKDWVMR